MNKTSTKYIMCQPCTIPIYINTILCANHAQHPCTSTMYINTIKYVIRYHQWSVSTICLYQHANHVPQPSVISLMICLHHESSATTMYLNQSNVSTISSHISCTKVYANQVIPMVYFSQILSSTNIYHL
jgi:hypothetical protein